MTKILVVEDEESFSEALAYLLGREGFEVTVADSGPKAIEEFDRVGADLVLLDLMLPGLSGTEVCKQIRQRSDVPIIMLTAKDSEVDKVVGLELGADDYVTKPYSSRELVARIRAVLRRNSDLGDTDPADGILTVGPVRLDTERHVIAINGSTVQFPLKEFELLEFLMRNCDRVLTRTQIIDRVWGSDYVGDTTFTSNVYAQRLKLIQHTQSTFRQFVAWVTRWRVSSYSVAIAVSAVESLLPETTFLKSSRLSRIITSAETKPAFANPSETLTFVPASGFTP